MPLFRPPALSVTELTRYLRTLLESDEMLQDLWVQGEVSNFSRPSSGHLYFTLKDSSAALRCVMWRSTATRQTFIPRDGDAVEVHGAINIYDVAGQYQLYASLIRPAGEGLLYQEFLRLKARLEAEGLFDPQRKRAIPPCPQRIGIVTSPTGAALRDMLNTLRRRYPLAEVILAPTPVQGDEAPPGIVAALQALNRLAAPDVILLARGGGSIEDLWAFNDERVARAIAASPAPVITGVGHETDFTIADFVADLRAPTPTAAAELATPDQSDLQAAILDRKLRLGRTTRNYLDTQRWALTGAQNDLLLHSPRNRLASDRQRLDELSRRAESASAHAIELHRSRLDGAAQRLGALNPLAVLGRGFALLTNPAGEIVYSVRQAAPGQQLNVRVSDGSFSATADEPRRIE
ncbi:MAG: exodeoxyribonuclease VII large subunit [Anaerolineales bacterium]|nr:exodeoxyribonuclease VII large subunit [Anaerolineales bacterium]